MNPISPGVGLISEASVGKPSSTSLLRATGIVSAMAACGSDASWAGGAVGICALNLAMGEALNDGASMDCAACLMNSVVLRLGRESANPSLFSGHAGTAWLLTHGGRLLATKRYTAIAAKIVSALRRSLSCGKLDSCSHDIVFGLAGIGVAAMAYGDETGDYCLLEEVITALGSRAEFHRGGVRWYTSHSMLPRVYADRYPLGFQDFGVAHGHVGIAAMLMHASARLNNPKTWALATSSISWLQASLRDDSAYSLLPSLETANSVEFVKHLGWCYGDLGAAASLGSACRVFGSDEARALVDTLVVKATESYSSPDFSPNQDMSLCHGSAGRSLLTAQLSKVLRTQLAPCQLSDRARTIARIEYLAACDPAPEQQTKDLADASRMASRHGLLMGDAGVLLSGLVVSKAGSADWWAEPLLLSVGG